MKSNKPVGIIGGMGPYASAYLYKLLLDKSRSGYGAKNNSDYPEIVIDSVPISDFISEEKYLPIARQILISRTKRLKTFGCKKIYLACNSGHVLADDIRKASGGRFVSLIEIVAEEVGRRKKTRVGILGSSITKNRGLYEIIKDFRGVDTFYPADKYQLEIDNIIRNVIANKCESGLVSSFSGLTRKFIEEHNLDLIVLGCTELPLVFPKGDFVDISIVDSLEVLAISFLSNYYEQRDVR